ncbi:hypothetical protein OSTOST_09453, partial [Ostertagia ostertagi]
RAYLVLDNIGCATYLPTVHVGAPLFDLSIPAGFASLPTMPSTLKLSLKQGSSPEQKIGAEEWTRVQNFRWTCADVANNELLGWPVIHCNAETIEMRFATKKEFQGKVYVKGSYNHPECRVEYSSKVARRASTRGIKIEHGACNMSRQRLAPPEGMILSTVLVISFHPLFITKADKMFSVRCMYKEASHSITARLHVSMLPSVQLPTGSLSPTCSYTIRRDSLDGEVLAYAKVGDQVVHRWNCDT